MAMNRAVVSWELGLSGGNNPNILSISNPSNYKEPKLLSFNYKEPKSLGLNSKTKLHCFYSPFTFRSATEIYNFFSKAFDFDRVFFPERYYDFCVGSRFPELRLTILTLRIKLLEEDGLLSDKFKQMYLHPSFGGKDKHTSVVLDEYVPCLLENADRWISSCFIVAGSVAESCIKVIQYDMKDLNVIPIFKYDPFPLPANVDVTHTRCTEVIIDMYLQGGIDEKIEGISTREDLKVFVQQMNSLENMISAVAMSHVFLVPKEKTAAFSHINM